MLRLLGKGGVPALTHPPQLVEYLKLKADGLIYCLKEACPNSSASPGEWGGSGGGGGGRPWLHLLTVPSAPRGRCSYTARPPVHFHPGESGASGMEHSGCWVLLPGWDRQGRVGLPWNRRGSP